jgi:hypothetical protein
MNKTLAFFRLICVVLFAALSCAAGSAFATGAIGAQLDNWCATQPAQAAAPQQSRPYLASGSSCSTCHTGSPTISNLNALGVATASCSGSGAATVCGASVTPFCVAHAPSGVSITAPAVGTTIPQGQSLTFTGATTTNPDNFPLVYTWQFSSGQPNATGQSVSVPMTAAGSVTSTLQVSNSASMPATGTLPTRLVIVTPGGAPALALAPAALSFTVQAGAAAPSAQTVSATSSGAQVNVSASATTASGGSWLSVAPASGTTPASLSVAVNPSGLAVGTFSGTISVAASGVSNSPRTVPVTLTVTAGPVPTLTVAPASLSFTVQAGAAGPPAQNVSTSSSGAQVSVSATATTSTGGSWLSVAPASATTPSALSVSVNPSGLAAGTFSGTVSIASSGVSNSPRTVAVTLTVTPSASLPTLALAPTTMSFTVQAGGLAPPAQSLSANSSAGTLVGIVASALTMSGGNWLSVAPVSATTPAALTVSVNPLGLAVGTFSGTVSITSAGFSNSPATVVVTLTVTPATIQPVAVIVVPCIDVSVLPGGTVNFLGSGSDPRNQRLSYRWTFPGGRPRTSQLQNPGPVTFPNAGTFTVVLTVANQSHMNSAPATRVITVAAANQSPGAESSCTAAPHHEDH